MNSKEVREYLRTLIAYIDSGRKPQRIVAPRWVSSLVVPVSLGLSLGLGACIGEELPEEDMILNDGKADIWGDETDQSGSCLTPPEICDDGLENDGDGFPDCFDYDCYGAEACLNTVLYAAPMEQNCENGQDDNGNGQVDCEDPDCANHCACQE